jgi:RNA-directed DNA polymerase
MLAYLALCPQWEAQFEAESYGFRPGRSVQDAIEAVFLGISKKPKWVLDADISKCFDELIMNILIEKCNTFPEMRKQITGLA